MDSLRDKVKEMERDEILNALRECRGIMAKAARKLGITERMIGYKIKKYGIEKREVEHIGGERREEGSSDGINAVFKTEYRQYLRRKR